MLTCSELIFCTGLFHHLEYTSPFLSPLVLLKGNQSFPYSFFRANPQKFMSFTQEPSLQWLIFPELFLGVRSAMNHTFSEPHSYIPLVTISATSLLSKKNPALFTASKAVTRLWERPRSISQVWDAYGSSTPLQTNTVPRLQPSEALKDVLNFRYELKMLLSQNPKHEFLFLVKWVFIRSRLGDSHSVQKGYNVI